VAVEAATVPEQARASSSTGQYSVLVNCAVREGPENATEKVGEHSKGTVIDVVNTAENSDGLVMLQTSTPPIGWVKLKTSKGRKNVERVSEEGGTRTVKEDSPKTPGWLSSPKKLWSQMTGSPPPEPEP
jgi:hypothetical protein